MGVASGCGYKEVYSLPHIIYLYSSCICSFLQQHPYFFDHVVIIITLLQNIFLINENYSYLYRL